MAMYGLEGDGEHDGAQELARKEGNGACPQEDIPKGKHRVPEGAQPGTYCPLGVCGTAPGHGF